MVKLCDGIYWWQWKCAKTPPVRGEKNETLLGILGWFPQIPLGLIIAIFQIWVLTEDTDLPQDEKDSPFARRQSLLANIPKVYIQGDV